ncbi:MAG: multi-sensor signal transduction histidine kinase [Tardiphaga sp.]|uniref:PAS domain-containing protein n=1 Tax=Tardiphaga sp. TaxID=1926292 RepID=UPI002621AC6C|nr:PAS domain-containing protein [Tardiphaga sp.]MDB5503561.1 multi-sensor signal transduction histidine kinase [Tardiphaga sp.]
MSFVHVRKPFRTHAADGAIASLAIAATLAGGLGLHRLSGVAPSASLFSFAIMLVAWSRGIVPAIFATALTVFVFKYFFLEPIYSLSVRVSDIPQLVFFALAALLVSFLCDSERRAKRALKDAKAKARANEARLAEIQRELQLTIDSIPAMISAYRPDGVHSYVNAVWTDYTGMTLDEVVAAKSAGLFHPDDPERAAWQASLASGEPLMTEAPIRRADGVYQWFSIRRTPLRDDQGRIVRWYSIGFNIEDRKNADNALRDSEARLAAAERQLRQTLDHIPILAWRTKPDGYAEYLNKRWLDYAGFTLEDSLGWQWMTVIHPDDLPGLQSTWTKMLEAKVPGECEARMRRADGAYRWFLFRAEPLRDEVGAVAGWYGTNTDIEDRKQAENALQRNQAYLAEAQKLSSTGSFALNTETGEHFWSEQTYHIMQQPLETRVTTDLVLRCVHPDDRLKMVGELNQALEGGEQWDYEIRLLMPDQSLKYLHVIARRVTYEAGHGEVIGALMDVTEARKSQEALYAAQSALAHAARVATLGEISATIAHEVNQPLAAIVANGQACLRFLDRREPDLGNVRGAVEWIVKDGNRAADVIRRVRGLMTKAHFEKSPVSVNEIIEEVEALLRRQLDARNVLLRFDLKDVPSIVADRTQLQQVVINLVMNAIEAMQDITDRARILVIRSFRQNTGRVAVAFDDSGPGIPDDPEPLFDAFFSTKASGLGMGLSICRSIVEAHGGRLWAMPNPARLGAVFQFELPPEEANERN